MEFSLFLLFFVKFYLAWAAALDNLSCIQLWLLVLEEEDCNSQLLAAVVHFFCQRKAHTLCIIHFWVNNLGHLFSTESSLFEYCCYSAQ